METKRNGEIDTLRFMFSLIILFGHFSSDYDFSFFKNGYIGVEFFFVVSGYLMAKHVRSLDGPGYHSDFVGIADSTWKYLWSKIKAFYRYYLSVIVLQVLVRYCIINRYGISKICFYLLQSIPSLTLTFMALDPNTILYVGNTWYLSVMLIAIILIYPMLLKNYDFSVKIVFPIITIFGLGYLYQKMETITAWQGYSGFINNGVLRGICEMALGGSIFELSLFLVKDVRWNNVIQRTAIKTLITILKYFSYLVVFCFAYGSILGNSFSSSFSLHALLFCAIGIFFSFSNTGICVSDSLVTRYLGRISLPIFIFHGFIRYTCWDLIGHSDISVGLFATMIIMSVLISVGLMYLTDWIIKVLKIVGAKI